MAGALELLLVGQPVGRAPQVGADRLEGVDDVLPVVPGGPDDPEAPFGLEPLVDVLGIELAGFADLDRAGGSARTLGNMNRPHMPVSATTPAVNEVQATAIQETKRPPIMKPRRSVCARSAAAAAALEGLGRTVWGLAGDGLGGSGGFGRGGGGHALAATSLAFLAPVWRRASARSRGSVILSSGGSVRAAAAALAAGAAAGLAAAGLAARRLRELRLQRPRAAASFSCSVIGRPRGLAGGGTPRASELGAGASASAGAASGAGAGGCRRRVRPEPRCRAARPGRRQLLLEASAVGPASRASEHWPAEPRAGAGAEGRTAAAAAVDLGNLFGRRPEPPLARPPLAASPARPVRARSRISCTLGRFAIALVPASDCSPGRQSSTAPDRHNRPRGIVSRSDQRRANAMPSADEPIDTLYRGFPDGFESKTHLSGRLSVPSIGKKPRAASQFLERLDSRSIRPAPGMRAHA